MGGQWSPLALPALAPLPVWGQDSRGRVWVEELTSPDDGTSDTGHRALAFCWHREVWGGNLHCCHTAPHGATAFLPPRSSDSGCLAVPPQRSVGTGEMEGPCLAGGAGGGPSPSMGTGVLAFYILIILTFNASQLK